MFLTAQPRCLLPFALGVRTTESPGFNLSRLLTYTDKENEAPSKDKLRVGELLLLFEEDDLCSLG